MSGFQFVAGAREEDLPTGEVLAGKYRVEHVLGAGAMGVVVKVTQLGTGAVFALKFLRPSVARGGVAAKRFLREAAAVGRIQSPHVVGISDVGELDSGTPYLVMEYLHGTTLNDLLAGDRQLPMATACDYALQVAEGLAAAHAMGVLHRDIKPANLYVCSGTDGADLLKIVDFGVSKILAEESVGQHLTSPQASLGSPLFMAPEQMRSARTVDFRADQWSIGAVLYRMATGHLPFEGDSLLRVCVQVMQGDFVPVAVRCPELPKNLGLAIERCLKVSPDERFASIADLAEAISPFAGGLGRERAARCRQILQAT
jgi:serine/threonine-protein kinase